MSKHTVTAVTAKQLRDMLAGYPDDTPVVFGYNYGDHWNTRVLGQVEDIEEGFATWSSYHDMFKLEDDDEEIYDEEGEIRDGCAEVLVLG